MMGMGMEGMLDRLKGLRKAARALVRKGDVERELDEELAFHVEMETEKNVRAGMSPTEARRAALVSFRGVERYKEEVREARRARWLEILGQDVAMALRTLRRSPAVAAVVVGTLGLGIGAATAIFSVVDAAVLQPLPWSDPDRLVLIRETTHEGQPFTVSAPNYLDFRARTETLTEVAALRDVEPILSGDGAPERLRAHAATHTLFPLLGVAPAHGRVYGAEEDRPGTDTRVAVLSHGLWQRRFGGDPGVVGTRIVLDGEAHLVTGVMPDDFELWGAELWVPLAPDPASDRDDHWLDVLGRLAPAATRQQAEAELTAVSASLAATHPSMTGWGVEVRDLKSAIIGPDFARASAVLAGAVALLLLMACANVANLLLARGATRRGDLAVRAALGAGRGRLGRQLLVESLLLAVGGAAVGLLGAYWAVDLLQAAAPSAIPRVEQVTVDLRVVVFSAAVALLTAVLAGGVPAWQAAGTDAAEPLRSASRAGVSRGQRRLREALVVAQAAVAVVLLLTAGLMVRSFLRLQAVDPGFRTEDVWTAPLSLPESRYGAGGSETFFAYRDILEQVGAIPGVVAAAGTFVDPFSGMNAANDVTPAERAAEFPHTGFMQASWRVVTPSYFETLDVPLLAGRLFTPEDRYGAPATVLITRTLAERLWPGEDAVGRRLFWGGTDGEPRTVIGVVGDVRDVALDGDPPAVMFLSYRQLALPMMTLLLRTEGQVPGLGEAVRRAVWAVDPGLPIPEVRPMARSRAAAVAGPRFNTLVLTAFAAASLALAAVGLYGLLGFLVARRTREIGVRRALGARTGAVAGMVVRRALKLTAVGVLIGLVVTVALSRSLEALLYRTGGTDLLTFIIVPLLFALVAALAAWVPARRASRVDPLTALRTE